MLEDCFGHVAVNVDHYILVFSGKYIKNDSHMHMPLSVIQVYNLYTEQWRKHTIPHGSTLPATRIWACAMVIRSDVYMFGGNIVPERSLTNELWKLAIEPQGSFAWSTVVMTSNEKTPSPRACLTGWEYTEKLWTFGGWGSSPAGFLNDYGEFDSCCNNQLLCFDPSNEEWTNLQYYGMVPQPRSLYTATASQEKVWLYGGTNYTYKFNSLHELNMHSFTWTLIQTRQLQQPQARSSCTLSTISGGKLILHGGESHSSERLSDTWILDLKTKMWKRLTSTTNTRREGHTASRGINNSVIIIGGLQQYRTMHSIIFHVLTEPKSLQQLALQKICKHHTVLPWRESPEKADCAS